jgi:hypothetical protein
MECGLILGNIQMKKGIMMMQTRLSIMVFLSSVLAFSFIE